jgi:hypothetical protein
MPRLCVIDTMVLRKANAPLTESPREGRAFAKRVALLGRIRRDELRVLFSSRLMKEYREQVREPRNDFIKAFFELLTSPDTSRENWPPWPRRHMATQSKCRFPNEDTHVLRTALVEDESSTIFTEEERMLRTDACIYRQFRVHISDPTSQT